METSYINRTHIIALKEDAGTLHTIEIPIERPEQLIAELKAMIGNPNRTTWDMQSLFTSRFKKSDLYLDYIYPHPYNSSFVNGIHYPSLTEYDELRESWTKAARTARESYLASCKQRGTTPEASIGTQDEATAVNNLNKNQKNNFFKQAMRWIDAYHYSQAADKLAHDNKVKMYSKENIGWNNFTHRVNNDIKVMLKTNFGFGSAAHFLLGVQYKGLNILPYSYIVKYYNANRSDIVRCLRSFRPCRESWQASFDFVSDFVNKSIADPENFVKSYILREVREMMEGLEAIATNPNSYIEKIGENTGVPLTVNISPMSDADRSRMRAYPDETPILFKVEKITGALDFLESLTEIAKDVNMVQPHINRLMQINMDLYPEIIEAIEKTSRKVAEHTLRKKGIETHISQLAEELGQIETEINKLRAEATKENPFNLDSYETSHPVYQSLKEQRNALFSHLNQTNNIINDLNSFVSVLNQSLSKIDEVKRIGRAA